MQKTAQKRSLLNKLREMTDVSGIATEKFFNPEFKELMERLRTETDDPVRAIVTGEQIGEASPPPDAISLKDLLKSAKSNINRREYMKAVSDLGRFHKKMDDVVRILSSFKSNVDKVHEKFLFEGIDDESKQHLHDLKSRFASRNDRLVKEANILDFFTNIATERGRALAGWEKRYPKQVAKLKGDTAKLLVTSERLLSVTLSVLKGMAQARSVRNPDKYIEASDKIIREYGKYNTSFKDYYSTNVKGFLEKQELIAPSKTDTGETPKELGNQEVAAPPKGVSPTLIDIPSPDVGQHGTIKAPPIPEALVPPPPGGQLTVSPTGDSAPPSSGTTGLLPPPIHESSNPPPVAPLAAPPPLPKMTPEEMRAFESQHRVSHQKFYDSLQKLSNESPAILAMYISKYAKSIQSKDLATAVKLFKLAKSIEV